MSDDQPTVFVVDDDVSVRESLEALFRLSGWRARAYASAEAFLACPVARAFGGIGCLVLDISLPDLDGLDLQALVAPERSELPIIFITGHGDIPKSVRAMKAGAMEFLTKPFDNKALVEAVAMAHERSRVAGRESSELRVLQDRFATLSPREREVMALVVTGLLNKQVGGKLGVSEITIKRHRGRVMEKMQARSLAALVKFSERLNSATANAGPSPVAAPHLGISDTQVH
jgi:FixJ family two-component response regulator